MITVNAAEMSEMERVRDVKEGLSKLHLWKLRSAAMLVLHSVGGWFPVAGEVLQDRGCTGSCTHFHRPSPWPDLPA